MSGPKVVRIVTREEVLAICEALLHRLDQAITAWIASGQRIGELSTEEIVATHERRKALAALIAKDAFMELQKKVPDEIAFLKADVARRQRAAVEKAEQGAKRRRQGRDSATTLVGALKSKNIVVPQELASKLGLIASGEDVANADALLAQGFSLLVSKSSPTISEAQQNLASRLLGNDSTDVFLKLPWHDSESSLLQSTPRRLIGRRIADLDPRLIASRLPFGLCHVLAAPIGAYRSWQMVARPVVIFYLKAISAAKIDL